MTNRAEVVVIEAPVFKEPSVDAKVIQYFHKGDELLLHPAEIFKDPYEKDMNLDEKLSEKLLNNLKEKEKDPMFIHRPAYEPDRKSKFYKLADKLGNDAWILKEHVHVFYEDRREFNQKIPNPDPTDYVLAEPLPDNYPLLPVGGYRAYLAYSFGVNTKPSYPYNEEILDQSLDKNSSLDVSWSRYVNWDDTNSFYFGVFFSLKNTTATYKLSNPYYKEVEATETNQQILIGPRLEYDVWKSRSFRFNINTSLLFTLDDNKKIEYEAKNVKEVKKVEYETRTITPMVGLNLQNMKLFTLADIVVGANLYFNLPKNYSRTSGSNTNYNIQSEEHTDPFQTELAFFFAIQKSI